jgi:hypothetical protein
MRLFFELFIVVISQKNRLFPEKNHVIPRLDRGIQRYSDPLVKPEDDGRAVAPDLALDGLSN